MKKKDIIDLLDVVGDNEEVKIVIDPDSGKVEGGDVHEVKGLGFQGAGVGYVIYTKEL